MKTVKIIGVPEHFNLPWHMAIEEGAFRNAGIDLCWTDIPEGTGRMCKMLEEGSADVAIILTEGIVKSIADGNQARIVQEYIATPLLWGIHVAQGSPFRAMNELEGAKAAISRYGSGSHLMAYVNAEKRGWDTRDLQFEIVNSLEGAIKALTEGWADYFMWEHFTTKPLVDKGIFRRLDDCPTPWPCFVIAVRYNFLEKERPVIREILRIINEYTIEFKDIPSIDRSLSNRYEQELEDIQKWLSITKWSQSNIKTETIQYVIDTLYNLKLLSNKILPSDVLTN